ncbi:MAG: PDZ domain-containing protein [Candidatus Methylomirabilota bacterium]
MSRCLPMGALAGLPLVLFLTWLLAIPARASAQATPDLGWLGISISEVNEDLAERLAGTFGPGAGTGVVVADVLKGGPAEGSFLKRGDVIIRVDNQPIWDVRQLQRAIRSKPISQRVTLVVLRQSSRLTVPVTIGAMPVEARAQLAGERFGFLVRGEDERDQPRERPAPGGRVFVAFVDPDSPAARAGLRPQDAILLANNQPIRSLEDFDRAMRGNDRSTSLLVERRDAQAPIAVTLELPAR